MNRRLESSEKFRQDDGSLSILQSTEGIYESRGTNSGKLSNLFTEEVVVNRKNYLGCT